MHTVASETLSDPRRAPVSMATVLHLVVTPAGRSVQSNILEGLKLEVLASNGQGPQKSGPWLMEHMARACTVTAGQGQVDGCDATGRWTGRSAIFLNNEMTEGDIEQHHSRT